MLIYHSGDGETVTIDQGASDNGLIVCPGGPVLVRSTMVIDDDGQILGKGRRVIALCRCGRSGLASLCDGSHKMVGHKTPS